MQVGKRSCSVGYYEYSWVQTDFISVHWNGVTGLRPNLGIGFGKSGGLGLKSRCKANNCRYVLALFANAIILISRNNAFGKGRNG